MDKRERLARQLLMRGHASVDELLHASFGEWPPRGLEIVHTNTRRVNLVSSLATTGYRSFWYKRDEKAPPTWPSRYAGAAWQDGARAIFVDTRLPDNWLILGHELVHILQGDHHDRMDELIGRDAWTEILKKWQTPSDRLAAGLLDNFKPRVLRRAFNAYSTIKTIAVKHVIPFVRNPAWLRNPARLRQSFADARMTANRLDYLARGAELQARLHEILIVGYPHWTRMPQNRNEFLFAMRSLGFIKLPPGLLHNMNADPRKAELARAFPILALAPINRDLENLLRHLNTKGQAHFWGEIMPRLYADLIEMYGDKPGRERMGLGVNEIHLFRKLHESTSPYP